jgi:hypothetical protein
MDDAYTECDLLILGHPRCGSASLAMALRNAGLELGHERLLRDGMVSWWHVGFYQKDRTGYHFRRSARDKPALRTKRVWRYVRRPSDALPSIVVENEFNNRANASFQHRRRVIMQEYSIDIGSMTPHAAATYSYALWNELAASICSDATPIRIEKPHLEPRLSALGITELPRTNTTHGKFGQEKGHVSLEEFLHEVDRETQAKILEIENGY